MPVLVLCQGYGAWIFTFIQICSCFKSFLSPIYAVEPEPAARCNELTDVETPLKRNGLK